MQSSSAALRILQSVATLAGADDALAAINTTIVSDRAIVAVDENNSLYMLRKNSTATESSPDIIAPDQGGPGRWYRYGAGDGFFQTVALVVPALGANSGTEVTGVSVPGIVDNDDVVTYNLKDSSSVPAGLILGLVRISGANTMAIHVNNVSGATIAGATYALRVAVSPSP